MTRLRDMFAERVQRELESQCRKVLGKETQRGFQNVDSGIVDIRDVPGGRRDTDIRPSPECGQVPPLPTNVRVGFARPRAPF
jgi:hypothetical protein